MRPAQDEASVHCGNSKDVDILLGTKIRNLTRDPLFSDGIDFSQPVVFVF